MCNIVPQTSVLRDTVACGLPFNDGWAIIEAAILDRGTLCNFSIAFTPVPSEPTKDENRLPIACGLAAFCCFAQDTSQPAEL